MRKSVSRVTSLILCVAMIITFDCTGITTAFAASNNTITSDVALEDGITGETEVTQYSPVTLESLIDEEGFLTHEGLLSLKEIPYDAEMYTEIVDNGDGTHTLRQYTEPIMYQTETGEYEDIDSSIVEVSPDSSSENIYETAAADVEVQMSDNLNQSDAIEVTYDDYNIGFQPQNVLTANGESSADVDFVEAETEITEENIETVEECESVIYTDTFEEDTNIVITPTSTGVKEEIVLYEIPSVTEYSYMLTVKDVVPLLREDGNLYFIDLQKGMVVAAIPIPNMYDCTPESGPVDIPVTLEKTGENTYRYTLYPDQEFLRNAIYPVVIDPTVTTQSGGIYDTQIKSTSSGTNYCNDTDMRVGRDASGNRFRSLIQINSAGFNYINSITSGCTITNIRYWAYENYSGASSPTVELYPITSAWAYNTVTWANQPNIGSILVSQVVASVGWYSWDITSLGLYGATTNGILLKNNNETLNMFKRFSTDQASSNRDYFEFTYVDTTAPIAPSLSISPNASSSWTNYTSYPAVSWGGITDAGCSGLSYVQYRIDGGAWQYAGTSSSGSTQVNVGASGAHTIYVRGVDGAGNIGAYNSIEYFLDTSFSSAPPALNENTAIVTNGELNSSDSASIKITVNTVTDNLSGTAYYQIIENGLVLELSGTSHLSTGTYTLTGRCDYATYNYAIRAYDNAGNQQTSTSFSVTTLDRTGPTLDANSVSISSNTWISGNPIISWGSILDQNGGLNNSGDGTGTDRLMYQVGESGEWKLLSTYTPYGSAAIDTSTWADGSYIINVKAIDVADNSSDQASLSYNKDSTAPDTEFISTINESVIPGTNSTAYQISASVSDDHLSCWKLDWALGTNPLDTAFDGNVIAEDSTGAALDLSDYQTWNLSGLEEGRFYTLRLTAVDEANNTNEVKVKVLYALDTEGQAPKLTLNIIDITTQEVINPNSPISVSEVGTTITPDSSVAPVTYELYVNDELDEDDITFNPLEYNNGWVYPDGSQVFLRVNGTDNVGDDYYSYNTYQGHIIVDIFDEQNDLNEFDNNNVVFNTSNCIELSQSNGSYAENGYIISDEAIVNGLITFVNLSVDQDISATTNITFYLVYDGGQYEINPNVNTEVNISTNGIRLKAVLISDDGTNTPAISSWNLDVSYIAFGDSVVINNSFEDNARGFGNMVSTVYDETDFGSIKLNYISTIGQYAANGTVESTLRTIPGDAWEAFLSVTEDKPEGTNITYEISTDGGQTWNNIAPGNDPNTDTWIPTSQGNQIVLRATLTSDGTDTPSLESWSLQCRQTLTGSAYDIQLIDPPDNLSTLVDANYMTLLRWEPSETAGVTYNIYRSTDPYFEPSAETYLASTENAFYYDYNLIYNTTFCYKVVAAKTFYISETESHERESLPSNEAWAHTVTEDEMSEMLGLESYWSYSGFQTGGGTGYVNVANGNLVYQTADLVVSDPFLASAMTRTYNTMADTKTPMGYGWDYSFNTCLLKECDESGNIQALILKDGDGSFHRFDYNETSGEFVDASGTFMELSPVYNLLELVGYEIERKDGITCYFDAASMKIKRFTDNNGINLTLVYDFDIDNGNDGLPDATDRGNLIQIISSTGEMIELSYYVDGSEPGQGDYTYVNRNVDMVASVTWTEDTETNPESITYTYTYNEDDQLDTICAVINGETTCVQRFCYDVDLDNSSATEDFNVTIMDAEERITVVEQEELANGNRIVSSVYEPVQIDEEDPAPVLANYLQEANSYSFNIDEANSTTTVTNSQGVSVSYVYDENGLLVTKTDAEGNSITYEHDGNFLVTSMSYENTLNGEVNPTTIRYTYTYNSDGNIIQIKAWSREYGAVDFAALGSQTDYTYDTNHPNRVSTVSVRKAAGEPIVTSYTYDSNGNMLSMTVADGSVDANNNPIEKTTTYTYYGANDPNGLQWQLRSVEDEYGNETRYFYDSKGRVICVKQYDANNEYVRTTAAYTYDGFSRTDTVSQPYDENLTTTPGVTDLQYDSYGRLVLKVNADGTAEQWSYDLTGWLTTYSVGTYSGTSFTAENTTAYEYDLLGRLRETTIYNDSTISTDNTVSTIDYGYWDSTSAIAGLDAEKVTATDAEGTRTIQYYDVLGRLVKTKIFDGTSYITTAEYTYDDIGNVTEAVDNAGTVTEVYYDEMNRQIKTIVDPFDSADGMDNLNVETHYTYDYLGNVTMTTQVVYESEANQANPEEIETVYTYDDLSRLVQVTQENPDYGQAGEPQYVETSYYYDQDETVNGENLIMNYTQDALGYINETYFNELGQTVMSLNRGDTSDGDDANGEYQRTLYGYTDTNSDGNEALGLADTVTRTDGTKEVYEYDSMGRATSVQYYEANAAQSSETVAYIYNDLGQVLTETVNSNGTTHATSYRYDRMGRTSSVWEGTYVNGDKSVVAGGLDVEYTYNDAGQVININYNTGNATEHNLVYVYDGYGRISQIKLDPVENGDQNIVREYFYDTVTGVLLYTRDYREFATVSATLGDYIQTDYDYNSAGMVSQITYSDADLADAYNTEGITEQYTIAYDGRGQITGEQLDTDYSMAADTTTVYKAYDYDSLGRLTTAVSGDNDAGDTWSSWDNQTTYAYDLDGNRETMDNGTEAYDYTYNQFNQLTAVTRNNAAYESYTYDLRGNQTQVTQAYLTVTVGGVTTTYNKTTTYEYDLSNQMTEAGISTPVADEQTGAVTYESGSNTNVYNEGGQRMSKTEEGGEERYFYTGSAILYTKNESGDLLTENILDPSGNIIASKRFDDDGDPGTTYELANLYFFYHYDIRGSVTAIIRPDGSLIEGYTYDEFGNLTWTEYDSNGDPVETVNEIFHNEVTYTGSITDTSTGLQYMNARYYDASTGRFLSQDTYTGNAYEPWTQHLYSYCGNNPTNFVDPTGHSVASIQAELDELKGQREIRIMLRNNYARNRWNYDEGSDMFNMLTDGWQRNRQIVKDLNLQIWAKEDELEEAEKNTYSPAGGTQVFGATSTSIKGSSTETNAYIIDTGFTYTYSTGIAEVDGVEGWLVSVGSYGDYRVTDGEPGACFGVTLDLITFFNLDLHYDADGALGVSVGLNFGDTTGSLGIDLGNPLTGQPIASVNGSINTVDSNNVATTNTVSADVGPFGTVVIICCGIFAPELLPAFGIATAAS